jgi:copper(I)-binding protein
LLRPGIVAGKLETKQPFPRLLPGTEMERRMPLNRRTLIPAVLLLACLAPPPGKAHEIKFGNLVVVHPWSRQSLSGETDGYMKIANHGTEDDRLVAVTADISSKVILCDVKQGMMVQLADGIPIPAGKTVELNSKSLHIMFMNVTSAPMAGAEFGGTLTFEKAGTLQVDFEVEEPE